MNAKTLANVQSELSAATWVASSPASVQSALSAAVWLTRPITTTTRNR